MDHDRLARIRLLTARFYELQGLRVAFAGAIMASVMAGYLIAATPTSSGALIAMLTSFGLMIPGEWWLHRYYARTFGRQVSKPRNRVPVIAFVLIYFAVGVYLDRRFPEIPAGAPTAATVMLASVWVAIRDWRWRAHYLCAPVAVITTFGANVFGAEVVDPGMTLATTLLAMGLSFVPIGLLDHRLLVKLLHEVRDMEVAAVTRHGGDG